MKSVFLIFCTFLLIAEISQAVELFEVNRSVRALGMGNAYISVVRDSDSIFYNPAGIGISGGVYWTIMDPAVGINGADALTEIQNFQNNGDFASAVTGLAGKKIWIGGGGKMALRLPYSAFAIYNNIDASVAIDDPDNPVLELNYINDLGYAMGFGAQLLPFSYFGFVVRKITRTGQRKTYDPAAVVFTDFDADLNNVGTGLAFDAGFTFLIDTPVAPAFSLVMRNVGGTKFTAATANDVNPPDDEEEWIAGASVTLDAFVASITPSLDVKHINKSEVPLGRKLHMGVEFSLPLVDIRAGLHQNYWSAGVGLGIGPIQLDIASWGVELGEEFGQQEDRRYMLQLTLELGLDLGFGGGSRGSGGGEGDSTRSRRKRAKLKRRR